MKIFFTVFALFFSLTAMATPLNKIVVFGDSLSDNGNFYEHMKKRFPTAPYYEGRFSNGPVWIEHVSSAKQAELLDYAYGGAGVLDPEEDPDSAMFNLHQEVSNYLSANNDKADDESLYTIWIGANNYLSMPEDTDYTLKIVLGGIKNEMRRLVEKGGKHFLIVNLPDLGMAPMAYDYEANDALSVLSIDHNTLLRDAVTEFQNEFPDSQWVYLNVAQIFNEAILDPERLGFSSETLKDTCYDKYPDNNDLNMMSVVSSQLNQNEDKKDPCEGYLFFDLVHPTALAHKIMAERTLELFDKEGIEFEKKDNNIA